MARSAKSSRAAQPEPNISEPVKLGLALLLQAHEYSSDASADRWDFALKIETLRQANLTDSDLRWMVAKGYVQHGRETTVYGESHRSYSFSDGFDFDDSTCLMLSLRGYGLANRVKGNNAETAVTMDGEPFETPRVGHVEIDAQISEAKPGWDSVRRELSFDGVIVKRFRVPARNQEIILCVFQEEGWPDHIDDPLAGDDIDAQSRLHNAINRLNGKQSNRLISFHGNGRGNGVLWRRVK